MIRSGNLEYTERVILDGSSTYCDDDTDLLNLSSASIKEYRGFRYLILMSLFLTALFVTAFFTRICIKQKDERLLSMIEESKSFGRMYEDDVANLTSLLRFLMYNIEHNGNIEELAKLHEFFNVSNLKILDIDQILWHDGKVCRNLLNKSITAVCSFVIGDDALGRVGLISQENNSPDKIYIIGDVLKQKEYIGSVALVTHFQNASNLVGRALLHLDSRVFFLSHVENIEISKDGNIDDFLSKKLHSVATGVSEDASYMNIVTKQNFAITKLKNLPFISLVSISDENLINSLYYPIAVEFIEWFVVVVCICCIALLIHRREVALRKRAENLSRLIMKTNDIKSDFLAFAAHEIRSPLGFIITASELIERNILGNLSIEYKEYIRGINKNANLILEFISDILDESYILKGRLKIINSNANLKDIILTCVEINRHKFTKKNISIELDVEEDLPCLVCDERRILQVISNLLTNAVRYSASNKAVKIIAFLREGRIFLIIADEGIGMTGEELEIAFTKYGTIHRDGINAVESYGIGLSIVRMILKAHGAELIVSTEVGVGTDIKVIFPANRVLHNEI